MVPEIASFYFGANGSIAYFGEGGVALRTLERGTKKPHAFRREVFRSFGQQN